MKKTIAVLLLSLHCYGQSSEAKHWAWRINMASRGNSYTQ